jgi:hypothetical protein
MTMIGQDTSLIGAMVDNVDWNQNGWETCAARAFNVVIYTYNEGAAYSDDGGNTFHVIDANGLCAEFGKSLIGDQVITYVPRINQFAWVMLTTDQNLVLAMATPEEVQESGGTAWTAWLIPPGNFEDGKSRFDRPTVSAGDNFLYVAVNLGPTSIAIRLSLTELAARGSVHPIYFIAPGVFWLRAAQNTGSTGFFAALMNVNDPSGQPHISNIRVFAWPEIGDHFEYFDVPISAIPTESPTVTTPAGDWLSNGRGSLQILGLALSRNELWAAWWGNRTVRNPPAGVPTLSFPYPHIGIAVVNVASQHLETQRYVWNPDYAFAFPDLASNSSGDIGLAFCWGGARQTPQFGVGMLTSRDTSLLSITPDPSLAAGGDYITIRMGFPEVDTFCAAGFNVMNPGPQNHPHLVFFEP